MELRHLRCFMAVANELHFARAAEKLHIDQSPLSRTIKELEEDVGAQLFIRTTRSTRLTLAGTALLQQVPRIFLLLQQARDGIQAAATGCSGRLRIALSDGVSAPKLAALVALTREEEPNLDIHFDEVSPAHQIKGLSDELYECGFCQLHDHNHELHTELAWKESLHVALPANHPLLAYEKIRVEEVLRYPLLLRHPEICAGYNAQIEKLVLKNSSEPIFSAQRVASISLMLSLVSAGYALALVGETQIRNSADTLVHSRPLAGPQFQLSTYLLLKDKSATPTLNRLIDRLRRLEAHNGGPDPNSRLDYGVLRVC